ncbi:MAG: glycosyltransferase family 39 protein [Paludibacteraceae bacterium]|nr:glycosyltransferase family 39 protein [Paludibacteraceae bacterium]
MMLHWFFISLKTPIYTHDMLLYGTQGKIFAKNKEINYEPNLYDEQSRFLYRARHGYSFPLFLTWELLFSEHVGIENDVYFRSIPGYYWMLICAVFYLILEKKGYVISLVGLFILIITPGFFRSSITHNIDTFRMFFLFVSYIYVQKIIKSNSWADIFIFGMLSGITANAHSIGVFLVLIYLLTLFIFMSGNLRQKAVKLSIVFLIILLFGGYHYILDTFIGTGWIFTRLPS